VLQVIDHLGPGGAQGVVVNLMRSLDTSGFEVRLAHFFPAGGTHREELLEREGFSIYYLDKKLGFDPATFVKMNRVLRDFRPHVVHTHVGTVRYVLPVSLLQRVPANVHTIHNLAQHETLFPIVNRLAFRLGVCPVAIADTVQASVAEFYGIRDCVSVPNGIPVSEWQNPSQSREKWRALEGIRGDDFLFVNVARFEEQKNHSLLIRAFADLVRDHDKVRLVFAGAGEGEESAKALALELGVCERIHFLGARSDVPAILSASDVFVLSSKWEGNPLCVMEAMAAGLPVIATAVGGVPELVEDGCSGILVESENRQALSVAMGRVVGDDDLVHRMKRSASERAVERFDVSTMARAYEQLYRSLLQRHAAT
jgi:glycosyltransferase involved in cell wall biosynthesis